MIDLYNLELEIGYGADGEQIEMSRGEALELIVRLRQAEKDAARYRWVRSASIAELNEFCNMIRPHRDGFVDDAIIEDGTQCNK